MEHNDLLERAIASYASVSPSPHFVPCVLARAASKRRLWVWAAVPVLAAAACLVVTISVAPRQVPPAPKRPAGLAIQPESPPAPSTVQVRVRHRRLPRPAPMLTSEERALVRWVSQRPATAAEDWLAMQKSAEEAIEVKPLEVKPIKMEELSQ